MLAILKKFFRIILFFIWWFFLFPLLFIPFLVQLGFFRGKTVSKYLIMLQQSGDNGERALFKVRLSGHFIQAKKYVLENGEAGVDLVVPLIGIYANSEPDILEVAKKFSVLTKRVPTEHEFSFLFFDLGTEAEKYETIMNEIRAALGISKFALFYSGCVPNERDDILETDVVPQKSGHMENERYDP